MPISIFCVNFSKMIHSATRFFVEKHTILSQPLTNAVFKSLPLFGGDFIRLIFYSSYLMEHLL